VGSNLAMARPRVPGMLLALMLGVCSLGGFSLGQAAGNQARLAHFPTAQDRRVARFSSTSASLNFPVGPTLAEANGGPHGKHNGHHGSNGDKGAKPSKPDKHGGHGHGGNPHGD
jgi:hypothetical protein